jgi:nitrogen fixation NifU-like protein
MDKGMEVFDEVEEMVATDAKKRFSETVVEHFHHPRNCGKLENYDCYTYMSGMCGDTVGYFVKIEGDAIKGIGFESDGCGPTVACASALTCIADGMSIPEVMKLKGDDLLDYLGGLPLENSHCADLAVNTLKGALEKYKEPK